ncbi:Ribosomal protein L23 [Spironucleus salmonicida]|uniref:Ribosomal protein L23 n=1 Tax=Spironucleus salmonicida TaxID=348837 RepID=V6LQ67_9EUKA|nr:Ribosomal protein L23 [Spironucleus salmonicida]|eukprot:EST42904.1 Ribosomal protein L23A [Spironucleus salmonicida]
MPAPAASATRVSKAFTVGRTQRTYKVRTSVHFFRPKTLIRPSKPLYERSPLQKPEKSAFDVLRYPIRTDANAQLLEKANTIVFIVNLQSTKPQIKEAFTKVFGCKVAKVNTLITPLGEKKAFIKLPADVYALDIAGKIGLA